MDRTGWYEEEMGGRSREDDRSFLAAIYPLPYIVVYGGKCCKKNKKEKPSAARDNNSESNYPR